MHLQEFEKAIENNDISYISNFCSKNPWGLSFIIEKRNNKLLKIISKNKFIDPTAEFNLAIRTAFRIFNLEALILLWKFKEIKDTLGDFLYAPIFYFEGEEKIIEFLEHFDKSRLQKKLKEF